MSINKNATDQKTASTTGLREGSPEKTRATDPQTGSKSGPVTGMREGSPEKTREVYKQAKK